MTQRNSPARAAMLAERAAEQRLRIPRRTAVPHKGSLSTRGQPGETWRTKRWTMARWRALSEATDEKLWANAALAEWDVAFFHGRSLHLRKHLSAHPNDGCARAALERL